MVLPSSVVLRRKLWVIEGYIASLAWRWWAATWWEGLVGSAAPDGTTECAPATRIAVKPCAGACPRAAQRADPCGAPLRGCGA